MHPDDEIHTKMILASCSVRITHKNLPDRHYGVVDLEIAEKKNFENFFISPIKINRPGDFFFFFNMLK